MLYEKQKKGFFDKKGLVFASYILLTLFVFAEILLSRQGTFIYGYDNQTQTYAWLYKQWAALHNGEIALWDFQPGGGSSFIGELQTAPLYLLNIIYFSLIPNFSLACVDIYIGIHFLLACYFMYLCLKEHNLSGVASYIGGFFFAYIAISKRVYAQANIFMAMIWLPIILVCLKRACESTRKWYKNYYMYFTGILLGISFLAGHMQPFLHNVICMGIWVLVFSNYGKKKLCQVMGVVRNLGVLIGCGIVCAFSVLAQVISCFEYIALSYRWVGLDAPVKGMESIPAEAYELYVLKWKDFLNAINSNVEVIEYCSLYVSVLGVLLIIIALLFNRNKLTRFAALISVFGCVCALSQNSVIGEWICRLPLLKMIREPVRYLYMYNIGSAILVALGCHSVEALLEKKIKKEKVLEYTKAVVMGVIAIFFLVQARDQNVVHFGKYEEVVALYNKTEALTFLENKLEEENNQYRTINDNKVTMPANIGNVIDNFFTTDSQRATLGIEYFEYLCRDWSFSSDNFKYLGTKYLVSREEKEIDGFELICKDETYYVYERINAESMFWQVIDNDEKVSCQINAVDWKTNSVTIDGEFRDGMFVFSQQTYPGWTVYVDGEKRDVETYDIFMAVNLSEGNHTIKFVYTPVWKTIGIIGVLIVCGLWIVSFYDVVVKKIQELKTWKISKKEKSKEQSRPNKMVHLEVLRLIAIFFVLFNHSEEYGYLLFIEEDSAILQFIYMFLSILCKVAVPLFFMISGALLLGKEEPIDKVIKHRILRYVAIICVFSFGEYIYKCILQKEVVDMNYFWRTVYSDNVIIPFWFLYAYLALMIMLPLLRKLVSAMTDKEYWYLLGLHLLFTGVIPILEYLIEGGAYSINLDVPLASTSIFCFISGYWMEKRTKIDKKVVTGFVWGSVVCMLISMGMTYYKMGIDGGGNAAISQNFHNSLIAIPTIAVYVGIKYLVEHYQMNELVQKAVCFCGSLTFGIYLLDEPVRWKIFGVYSKLSNYIPGLFACFIWLFCIMFIGGLITAVLKKIPVIKDLL